jgi:hypothetical protein
MVARTWSLALVAVVLVAGCGSAEVDTTIQGPGGRSVDCGDVIDEAVANAFGWDQNRADGDRMRAQAEGSRCVWKLGALGTLTAYAVEGSGTVRETYDAACRRIEEIGPLDEELKAGIAGGGTACVVGLDPELQSGRAEMVLLTLDDLVLDLRVDAKALLDADRLRSGLRELSRSAQQAFAAADG